MSEVEVDERGKEGIVRTTKNRWVCLNLKTFSSASIISGIEISEDKQTKLELFPAQWNSLYMMTIGQAFSAPSKALTSCYIIQLSTVGCAFFLLHEFSLFPFIFSRTNVKNNS